ncbi:mycofactocin-coupled SDR family oxidoreductase [Mycolicibacterium gadium]|uniref:3-ketoacyl-ACP reductase n=1 Tax=Mycolicibacterium gadium TaxID=1794 RepID=A0A7I7WLF8_MYCGU|nr:mycofactocin-coupled SDR family oxidoreductase [Mycolicibacterium gadium]MDG5481659.1 mycofactocin-coupled SDR family oxidoreductase [Mycolicibacterium gadium]BBZ17970.1 3-ketoacyl-ACP reductase [Mycolicibacterium gadium]
MAGNETVGRVADKRIVVTGAARGMGRSHAIRLAEEGADLVLVDICAPIDELDYPLSTEADLEETARLVREHGRTAITCVADVRDEDAMKGAVDAAAEELGGLDAAVANAGVLTVGTWDVTTAEQWRVVVDVNLIGVWNTCAAVIPHLVEQGGGSLVNISSSAGVKGTPLHVPYTASKHGIVGMSRALANELAAQSIRVNTVHPTGVMTGMAPPSMHDQMTSRTDLVPLFLNALPAALIEAVDVSNAVLFLISDESRYVTGLEFKVDAGVSIR